MSHAETPSAPTLVIVCSRPGLHRGGLQHPPVATYTEAQIRAAGVTPEGFQMMLEEPCLTLVMGELLQPADVDGHAWLKPGEPVTDAPVEQGLTRGAEPVSVVQDGEVVATGVRARGRR